MKKEQNSVIIIGGGPAGLAAAVYNARAGLSPLVFAGSPPGGQLTLTSEVENYPGFEHILGPELIERMRTHAKKFGAKIIDQNVTKVVFSKSPFTVETSQQSYRADAVLIATGAKALWLGLESETRLRGRGVSACATCDGFFFRDKTVAVVGGGDTALEEALTLTKFASGVTIIHRRDTFRASKIMQERVLAHPKIRVLWNREVVEVLGNDHVEGVVVAPPGSPDTKEELAVNGLFVAIGHKPDTDLFSGQIALDQKGYILTFNQVAERILRSVEAVQPEIVKQFQKLPHPYGSQTSVAGVFAAGDCVDYQYRQAATAAGMGVAASLDLERYVEEK